MKLHNSFNRKNIFLVILIVALLIAAFFYKSPVSFFARNIVFKISAPVMERFAGVAKFFGGGTFFSSKRFLIDENQRLKLENQNLVLKLGSLFSLERENEELRKLLKITEERPFFEFISARSVGFIRNGQDEYIFISRGVRDGIHSDLWVLDSQNVYVGRVVEAYQASSKVKLATSVSETINGVLPASGIRVLINGNGAREFLIDLVPENIEVKEGDEVLAAENWEYAGLMPLLGKIVEVGPSGSQVFKNVKAMHYFDPQALEPVFVVKKQ